VSDEEKKKREKLFVPLNVEEVQQTLEYVKKNYERKYRVTLTPTYENFVEALKVWKYGVTHHKGIVSAIIDIYGYRYRRMENFIRECKLWKELEGWLHYKVLTKIYTEYSGKKRNDFKIEMYLYHHLPEFLIGKHNLELCESLFREAIDFIGPDWSWTLDVIDVFGEIKVGDDMKQEEIKYIFCCTQEAEAELTFWKMKTEWKIFDQAKLNITLANYVLYYLKLCKEESDWVIWK
jgi:hypothetical protein